MTNYNSKLAKSVFAKVILFYFDTVKSSDPHRNYSPLRLLGKCGPFDSLFVYIPPLLYCIDIELKTFIIYYYGYTGLWKHRLWHRRAHYLH